jgi:hypothetical protein
MIHADVLIAIKFLAYFILGARHSVAVNALRYKPEVRWFVT